MKCDVCGNEYEDCFTLQQSGETYVFDCFECAIHALAPACARCGCKIVGHGVSREGEIFCCAHCARLTAGAGHEAAAEDVDDDAVDEEEAIDFELDDDADLDDLDDDADLDDLDDDDDSDLDDDTEEEDDDEMPRPIPRR